MSKKSSVNPNRPRKFQSFPACRRSPRIHLFSSAEPVFLRLPSPGSDAGTNHLLLKQLESNPHFLDNCGTSSFIKDTYFTKPKLFDYVY